MKGKQVMKSVLSFACNVRSLVLLMLITSDVGQGQLESFRITEISKINDIALRFTVDTAIEPPMTVVAILFDMDNGEQFSEQAERSDDSNFVFECALPQNLAIFLVETKFSFLVDVLDLDENPVMFAYATLMLKKMDTRQVTVVGTGEPELGAFLRVNADTLSLIRIGDETCQQENSPCYFSINLQNLGNFKWCTDVEDEDSFEVVAQCNEEITHSEDIPVEQDPTLLLLDKQILNLFFTSNQSAVEVLTLDPLTGIKLSNETVTKCENDNVFSCRIPVDIPESQRSVNFTVVLIDEEGYVISSGIYPFEIIPLEIEYMLNGAVYMQWTSNVVSNFTVSVSKGLNPSDIKFQMSVMCGGSNQDSIPCFAYFIRVEDLDIVSKQKEGEMKLISATILPPDY